jgi:hypothetical protein
MRKYFGSWGVELTDDEFAQALAALGVLWGEEAPFMAGPLLPTLRELVRSRLDEEPAQALWWAMPDRPSRLEHLSIIEEFPPLHAFSEAWRAVAAELHLEGGRQGLASRATMPRLCISWRQRWRRSTPLSANFVLEALDWLVRPIVDAASVFIHLFPEHSQPELARWPVPLGFLPGPTENLLRTKLDRAQRSTPLYTTRRLAAGHSRCGLLVLPYGMRDAVRAVLTAPDRPVADTVLVLGPTEEAGASLLALADVLLETCRSRALVLARVSTRAPDVEEAARYLHAFVDELAHNTLLDVAAFTVAREHSLPLPQIIGDGMYFAASLLSSQMTRLSDKFLAPAFADRPVPSLPPGLESFLETAPLSFKSLGEKLKDKSLRLDWSREFLTATNLSNLASLTQRASSELALEAPPRYLRTRVISTAENRPVDSVRPSESYRAEVSIGAVQEGFLSLDERLSSLKDEPPDEGESHLLQVIFFEPRLLGEPQVEEIRLPPTGSSTACAFYFFTRDGMDLLEARITVLHRNRVLQTGVLRGRVNGESKLTFHTDALARTRLQALGARPYFSTAIIVNHTQSGEPVITAAKDNVATRINIDERALNELTGALNAQLSEIAEKPAEFRKLRDAGNERLLRDLARRGARFHEVLSRHNIIGPQFHGQGPVQVVTARYGGFLPVELAYRFPSPSQTASLCTHAEKGLGAGSCPEPCKEGGTKKRICPLGFWSTSRVIERHAHKAEHSALPDDHELRSEPVGARPTLPLPSATVMAGSPRVNKVNRKALRQLETALKDVFGPKVYVATSWVEWVANVNKPDRPMLLVLLPHHTQKPVDIGQLELAEGDALESGDVEAQHVVGEPPKAQPPPVVLLLGCETQLARISFESFTSVFQDRGAAIVVATIATVLGRDAVPVAKELIQELTKRRLDEHSFGEVLLRAKRKLLRAGRVAALSLATYGDADWVLG